MSEEMTPWKGAWRLEGDCWKKMRKQVSSIKHINISPSDIRTISFSPKQMVVEETVGLILKLILNWCLINLGICWAVLRPAAGGVKLVWPTANKYNKLRKYILYLLGNNFWLYPRGNIWWAAPPDTILLLSRSVNYKMASFVTLLSTWPRG